MTTNAPEPPGAALPTPRLLSPVEWLLLLVAVGSVVAIVVLLFVGQTRIDELRSRVDLALAGAVPGADSLSHGLGREAAASGAYLATGDTSFNPDIRRARTIQERAMARLDSVGTRLGPPIQSDFAAVEASIERWRAPFRRLERGELTRTEILLLIPQQDEAFAETVDALARLESTLVEFISAHQAAMAAHEGRYLRWSMLLALLALLAGAAAAALAHRRARRLVIESQRKSYRSLFDNLLDLVYVQDLEGRFLDVNPTVCETYGYSRDELIGATPALLADPEETDLDETMSRFQRAVAGEPQRFDWCSRSKDGKRIPNEVILNRGTYFGRPVILAVARNLTERKRAETALRQSERRLAHAQSIAKTGSWSYWPEQQRSVWSYELYRLLGYDAASTEPGIDALLARVHPDDADAIKATMRPDAGEMETEFRTVMPDGAVRVLVNHQVQVGSAGNADFHYSGTVQDITERARFEAELRQAQKMEAVGRLAGGVAHDFNNLLTAIIGHTHLLLGDERFGDGRESMEEIRNAANRAAGLTRQLLAFSRKQVLLPRVLDLSEIVSKIGSMLQRLIGADIEMVTRTEPGLWRIYADVGQVEQVLLNLAVNARDAMPGGGVLLIRCFNSPAEETARRCPPYVDAGDYVAIEATDTGEGMDEAIRSRIFEPFFTTKDVDKGTGLGLSTVYGIAQQSGGYVWAVSTPGVATTFTVLLPRVPAEEIPQSLAQPGTTGAGAAARATILLAEDEESVRNLITRILENAGYRVLGAPNGAVALDLWQRAPAVVDLLLTDMVMPGMNGKALATRLRAERPALPTVLMSGYSAREEDTSDLSTSGFISKPFSPEALVAIVAETLETGGRADGSSGGGATTTSRGGSLKS